MASSIIVIFTTKYDDTTAIPNFLFIFLALSVRSLLCKIRVKAEDVIINKINTKVIACKLSTKVNSDVSGKIESIIYLLPTAAKSAPTGNPKRGSALSKLIKKLTQPIKNAIYIPIKSFRNRPQR